MELYLGNKKHQCVFFACVLGVALAFGPGLGGCGDDDGGGDDPVCGNGICEEGENSDNCFDDCGCGNDILNDGEECDGDNLGGTTCGDLEGFEGGTLACTDTCTFDTSSCEEQMEDEFGDLTILHTTDLHHHASGYGPFADYTPLDTSDNDFVLGGFARLGGLINEIRELKSQDDIPVLMLDAADYFMGTVYDMTYFDPVSLKFFQMMEYDAITIGNHEWDWGPDGLAMLFGNAVQNGGFMVPIVASNMNTNPDDSRDDNIEALVTAGVIADKLIKELPNGLRVGILGLLGPEADELAVMADPVEFTHTPSAIQAMVDDLRENDEVHMVVVMSHGGISSNGEGDDADLAENVNGIDVILSGHYHSVTEDVFDINDTLVYISGKYGQWLSQLDVTFNMTQGVIEDYVFHNHLIDDTIMGDSDIQTMVEGYHVAIDMELEDALGLGVASPIVEVPFDMPSSAANPFEELPLSSLCSDSLRVVASAIAFEIDQNGGPTYVPYTLGVVPHGTMRDGLYEANSGYATFSDIYNVMPLGISPDIDNQNAPGWPLVDVYLTGAEIKNVAEVSVSVAPTFNNNDIFLGLSGIRVEYDSTATAIPPSRVQTVYLCGDPMDDPFGVSCTDVLDTDPSNTTLYRVVTDLYTIMLMRMIEQAGITIEPKFADGTVVDLDDMADVMMTRIDMDPMEAGFQEVKVWGALLNFVTDDMLFPDVGGIPGLGEIPSLYNPAEDYEPRLIDIAQ